MDEIAQYPVVQRLLTELCQLEAGDEAMPLAIIVNLHRVQLRAPFEGIIRLVRKYRDEDPQEALAAQYPHLRGMLGGAKLSDLWEDAHEDRSFEEIMDLAPELPRGAKRLLNLASGAWVNYDAAIALHHLTWSEASLVPQVALLDELLRQQAGTYEMLLDVRRYNPKPRKR
jgi:hypothetical protein